MVALPGATPVAEQELPFTVADAIALFELLQPESVGTGDPPVMLTANDVLAPTFTVPDVGDIETTTVAGGGLTKPSPPPPPQDTVAMAATAHNANKPN